MPFTLKPVTAKVESISLSLVNTLPTTVESSAIVCESGARILG